MPRRQLVGTLVAIEADRRHWSADNMILYFALSKVSDTRKSYMKGVSGISAARKLSSEV